MPELPDVEVFRRRLARTSLHQKIDRVRVTGPELLRGTSPQGLGRHLKGREFERTRRHGKYLFAELEGGPALVLHFGMTGELSYLTGQRTTPDYTCLLLFFDNGNRLAYAAPRKLGRIAVTDDIDAFVTEHELGPDALGLSRAALGRLLDGARGKIKSWLMDQSHIAGLGNVYTDELLFQAGIHPATELRAFDDEAVKSLHRAMQRVLKRAIEAGAQPERMPATWLLPNREAGASCPRCGASIRRLSVGGRSGFYCPACQRD